MSVTWTRKIVPVEVGSLDLDDHTLVLTAPARWIEFIGRGSARHVAVEASLHHRISLFRTLPRAELYSVFLMSFGAPNDSMDPYKQSFSWWLNLSLDVGRLMKAATAGPTLDLVLRASDLRGGTHIELWWPGAEPPTAAALTQEVYDQLLARLAYLVGFRLGYLEIQGLLPDWSLRCPETHGRFGCRRGQCFEVEDEERAEGER